MEVHVHNQLVRGLVAKPRRAPRAAAGIVLAGLWLAAGPARAFTLEVTHAGPSVVGEAHAFTAAVTGGSGAVTYQWKFGDDGDFQPGGAVTSYTFRTPGLQSVDVRATDGTGDSASAFFQHLVHHPLTPKRPASSTSIIHDGTRNRVYSVNQDNDTITAIDAGGLTKLGELEVYRRPESLALAPDGKLWVVHQDDYSIAIVDPERWTIERGFRLPYASQPVAVAMSPTGDAAYVSLMALGKLLKLDPRTGAVIGEVAVGPSPRGIAVSHDGKDVFVTRFISPDAAGEVVKVDAMTLKVTTRIPLGLDTETVDSDQAARGLPNYLFTVALTPDGRQAWVPGKKDNIVRGKLRDGRDLTHDTTVRPLAAIIDVAGSTEIRGSRIDLDDRSQPVHVEFSPFGNFAILALAGSNRIEIRDVNRPTQVFSAIGKAGAFPRASVLAPNGRLFVQAALSREVVVYDLSTMLREFSQTTPAELSRIPAVAHEKLSAEVLQGKRIFHDASDMRMANEGYLSCGGCHFEGTDDGRIYDFSTRGEGLRNTPTLLGRKGMGQGRLNWTGTADEVQDFEHQIRELFDGKGFIPDQTFHVGTRDQPLGDTKAGLSPDLDALASYVASLDQVPASPYRKPDGSLTADGVAGKELFARLGCDFCHGGAEFTDSARGMLHDVGTITSQSGTRAGGPLLGIDTPTLLGVWATAPYLHDGSAPTLRDVLTTKNATELHGAVSALSGPLLDQLVAYLQQIDGDPAVHRLPFDPPAMGGSGGAGAGGSAGGPGVNGAGGQPPPSGLAGGCSCALAPGGGPGPGGGRSSSGAVGAMARTLAPVMLGLLVLVTGMRPRRGGARGGKFRRGSLGALALAALLAALTGCLPEQPAAMSPSPPPTDWSRLAAPIAPDPELSALGTRQTTYDRVCARKRGDVFARALCAGPRRPEIRDLADLLKLVGLDAERAFALAGTSTSLPSRSVSGINPRLLVFPRVGGDRRRPDQMVALAFVRGEQMVELVSRDPSTNDYNFYVVNFEQPCSATGAGCDLASLLTEEIEHQWTAYSVYDQDDLEETSLDCLSCHQPQGHGTRRILRMQELASPWLHWFPQRFAQRTESDRVLLAQFVETHGSDKQYGGIPLQTIANALDEGSAAQLEALVEAEGFAEQPNPFDAQIVNEMKSGSSATWAARFETHLRGEAIAVPYPAIDVTDPGKRAAATRSYEDVVRGTAPRAGLLDIRDIFSADAIQKLSFVAKPGADGRTVLTQMCARCHDGRGNPQLGKSRFNVLALGQTPRSEKELAIARLNESGSKRMPPWRVGSLTPESIQAATAELQK